MRKIKTILIGFIIILSSCAIRPVGDEKNESATGFRSMFGGMWCGPGFTLTCVEKAIEEAKKDCAKSGKTYEYSSHDVSTVRYKCVAIK
jgi:hypothetical protein